MNVSEQEDQFLVGEYEQAWAHYRHVENARTQYLGFFFTASLGSAALAGPILAANSAHLSLQLLSAGAILAVLESFTFFVSLSVRRFGVVLMRYSEAMAQLRSRRVAIMTLPPLAAHYLWTGRSSRWLSAQYAADRTLTGFLCAGVALSAWIVGLAAIHDLWIVMGLAIALCTGCIAATVVALVAGAAATAQVRLIAASNTTPALHPLEDSSS